MGKQTEPPKNDGNKKKGGKSSTKNKTGGKARPGNVFGQLVNNVQSVSASQLKFKAPTKELRASTSSTNNLPDLNVNNTCGTGGRAKGAPKRCEAASIGNEENSDDVNEFLGGHIGLQARPKKSMYLK